MAAVVAVDVVNGAIADARTRLTLPAATDRKVVRWTMEEVPARDRGTSTAAAVYASLHAQPILDCRRRRLQLPAPGA